MEEVEQRRRTYQASRGAMGNLHKKIWETIHNGLLILLPIFLSMIKLQGPILLVLAPRPLLSIDYIDVNSENEKTECNNAL